MQGHLATIWKLMKGQRARYLGAIAALITASCFLYLAPLTTQVAIDSLGLTGVDVEAGDASGAQELVAGLLGGREFIAGHLWVAALVVVGVTVVAGVFTYLRGRWSAIASEAIARNVRDKAYDRLQRLPAKYHDKAETGDLIQRCTSDVETLRVFLANQVVEIGRASFMLVIPLPLMWGISPLMTVSSVVFLPVILVFSVFYFRKVRTAFKASDEAEGRMTTTIQENLSGIRVVRAFARQDFEKAKLSERNVEHRDCDHTLYKILAKYWSASDLLCFCQKLTSIGVGIWLLAGGRLSVGEFFFFVTAVGMFLWPVRMMGRILADLGRALVAIARLREVLDEPIEASDAEAALAAAGRRPLGGAIEFRGVRFAHTEGAPPALDGVSFKLEPGQTLGLLGRSGSGKSTIINLLLRLYDHTDGEILLDGVNLREIPREHVRAQCATVLQEPFLYSKTLRQNLAIVRPGAGEEELVEATMTAAVHSSIERFDDGYDTKVGERGVTLSGGQRQRIALARALLQEPAILVMDDSLSAVDTETERRILDALRQREGRHTTIVIAHRVSTLMHADLILVLDKGRVAQRGTHDELVGQGGLYQDLWRLQTSEPDDGADAARLTEEVAR